MQEKVTKSISLGSLKTHWRLAVTSLVLLLSLLSLTDNMIDTLGRGFLKQESTAFLKEAELRSQETFVLLSMGKASMAVVGSSTAGISFLVDMNVTLGKIISPLQDMFQHAWDFSLGSLTVILVSQVLLEIVEKLFEPYLIFVCFLLLSYELLRHRGSKWVPKAKNIVRSAVTLLIFLFIAFPAAITVTSAVSDLLIQKMSANVNAGIEQHNQLFSQNSHTDSLKNNAENSIRVLKENSNQVKNHIKTMHQYLYTHIALGLLEVVLLPLMLFWLFLKIIRLFLNRDEI
jgi:hypothetical protein